MQAKSTESQYQTYNIRDMFYFVVKLVCTKFEVLPANIVVTTPASDFLTENLMLDPLTVYRDVLDKDHRYFKKS